MKKFSVVFILFSMLLHIISLPLHTYAQENYYNMKNENGETDFIDGKIITDKDEEKVPLYESMNHDSEVLAHLYNGDTLKVVENYEEFSLVEIDLKYNNNIDISVNNNDDYSNIEILEGYIVKNNIINNNTDNTETDSPEKGQFKKVDSKKGIAQKSPTNVREEPSTKTNVIKTIPIGSVIEYKPINDNWYEISVDVNGKQQNGYI